MKAISCLNRFFILWVIERDSNGCGLMKKTKSREEKTTRRASDGSADKTPTKSPTGFTRMSAQTEEMTAGYIADSPWHGIAPEDSRIGQMKVTAAAAMMAAKITDTEIFDVALTKLMYTLIALNRPSVNPWKNQDAAQEFFANLLYIQANIEPDRYPIEKTHTTPTMPPASVKE